MEHEKNKIIKLDFENRKKKIKDEKRKKLIRLLALIGAALMFGIFLVSLLFM